MTKYRVKPGYTFGAFGTYREGDIVELPEADAQGFLDKLQPVPADLPSAPPEETPADSPSEAEAADTETPPDAPTEKVAVKRASGKLSGKPANG